MHFKLFSKSAHAAALLAILVLQAQAQTTPNWELGATLDVAQTSRKLELGARDQGLGLGHSDFLLRGFINQYLSAEIVWGVHTEDQKLEHHFENVWLQTRSMPFGLQARAGRFASQIGYLNELHPHADDFTERPLLHRAFLGGHWVDDGLRLNWTAPTPFYLRLGAEIFSGKKLLADALPNSGSHVSTIGLKLGNDIGHSHSWQWGVAALYNPRDAQIQVHEEHDEAGDEGDGDSEHPSSHDDDHSHSHGANFTGKKIWITDLVWKWSPHGNNRNWQLRLNAEYAQINSINRFATSDMDHQATTIGAVLRFHPAWEIGARSDWLRVYNLQSHDEVIEFTRGTLRENAINLAFKPSHRQTLRLQVNHQRATGTNDENEAVFANPAKHSIQLQYVLGFGAHGAHAY